MVHQSVLHDSPCWQHSNDLRLAGSSPTSGFPKAVYWWWPSRKTVAKEGICCRNYMLIASQCDFIRSQRAYQRNYPETIELDIFLLFSSTCRLRWRRPVLRDSREGQCQIVTEDTQHVFLAWKWFYGLSITSWISWDKVALLSDSKKAGINILYDELFAWSHFLSNFELLNRYLRSDNSSEVFGNIFRAKKKKNLDWFQAISGPVK